MDIPIWIPVLIVIVIGVLAIVGILKSEEYKQGRVVLFRDDLVAAVLHSQPTWDQVVEIAETEEIPLSKVYLICRLLLKDILTGADPNKLKDHRALIETYIREHRRSEPFEGLPNEVRIHLERLSNALQGNSSILEPLTQQIRELVAMHSVESKKQRRYTRWGFFLGLLGFAFAAYTYYFPYNSPQPAPTAATQAKPAP
jgi:hypothetical protein